MGKAGWGAGKGRFSSPNYSTVINMVQDRTNHSWSKRCLQFMVTIKKTNISHFWFIAVRPKRRKKKFSQIHINTRLQLFYYYYNYYYFKVFHLFLQGLATILQLLTSICSATTTRGRHKAWKSFWVGSSLHVVHFIQGRPWQVPSSLTELLLSCPCRPQSESMPVRNFPYWRILS